MFDLIPEEEKIYVSYDSPCNVNSNVDKLDDIHTPDFLNTFVSSRLLNHKLWLKVGVPIILLRNIDQSLGLCNGAQLLITKWKNTSFKVEWYPITILVRNFFFPNYHWFLLIK
jgi:hypothetical protein